MEETNYSLAMKSVEAKVYTIFSELVGDRASSLSSTVLAPDIIQRIKSIYAEKLGLYRASNLGMNMSDWHSDAAFVVALHLFPERFTDMEVRAGVEMFLHHAPNHIVAACGLIGEVITSVQEENPELWRDDQS
ncbi:MAG: hypothetical protein KA765_03960 [Thermoflexales bacterium]|nr:hypothetical protein [Thermoflexales bacterium]